MNDGGDELRDGGQQEDAERVEERVPEERVVQLGGVVARGRPSRPGRSAGSSRSARRRTCRRAGTARRARTGRRTARRRGRATPCTSKRLSRCRKVRARWSRPRRRSAAWLVGPAVRRRTGGGGWWSWRISPGAGPRRLHAAGARVGSCYLLTTSWSSSFMALLQAWSPFALPESSCCTDGPKTCDWMTESSGPLYWATTPFARSARIWPTGALLKNFVRSLAPVTPGSLCAAVTDGKVPAAWKVATCDLAVGQPGGEGRGLLRVLRLLRAPSGTSRPSWPRRPGRRWRSPSRWMASPPPALTWPWTTPSIQPGQTKVANEPSVNALPLPQSHWVWLEERPAAAPCGELAPAAP